MESVVVLHPHPYLAVLFGDGTVTISFLSRLRVLPQVSFKAISNRNNNNNKNNHNNTSSSATNGTQVFGRSMLYYSRENMLVVGDSMGSLSFFDLTKFWIASKESLEGKQQRFLSPASRAIFDENHQTNNNAEDSSSFSSFFRKNSSSLSPIRTSSPSPSSSRNVVKKVAQTSPLSPTPLASTMRKEEVNNTNSSSPVLPPSSSSTRSKLFGGGAAAASSTSTMMGRSAMFEIQKKQKEEEEMKKREQEAEEEAEKERARIEAQERKEREEQEEEFDDNGSNFPVRFLGTFTITKEGSINSLELYKGSLCVVNMVSNSSVLIIDLHRIAKLAKFQYHLLRKYRYDLMLLHHNSSSQILDQEALDDEKKKIEKSINEVKRQLSKHNAFVRVSLVLGDVSLFSVDEQSILRSSLGLGTAAASTISALYNNNNNNYSTRRKQSLSMFSSSSHQNHHNQDQDDQQQQQEHELASQALAEKAGNIPGTRRKSLQTSTDPLQTMFSGHSSEDPEKRMSMKSAQIYKNQLKKEISVPDVVSTKTLGGTIPDSDTMMMDQIASSDLFTEEQQKGVVRSGDFEAAMIKQREEYEEKMKNSSKNNTSPSRKQERRRTQILESQQVQQFGMASPSWDLVFISGQEFLLARDNYERKLDEVDLEEEFYRSTVRKKQEQEQDRPILHPFFTHRSLGGEACFEDAQHHHQQQKRQQQQQQYGSFTTSSSMMNNRQTTISPGNNNNNNSFLYYLVEL